MAHEAQQPVRFEAWRVLSCVTGDAYSAALQKRGIQETCSQQKTLQNV